MSTVDGAGPDVDVLAAGAVVWRPAPSGHQVALVHRPRYDDWSLPKGKLDRGETMPAAAVREVAEETGCEIRLGNRLGDVRYTVPEGEKLVRYWTGEARGGPGFTPNAETDVLRFVDTTAAAQLVSYDRDREIIDRFTARPVATSVLLIVRHAKAGSRSDWSGDDTDRPLSGAGRAQADSLAGLLALFGPDRIHSAPPLRCTTTVAPLAARLHMNITAEPLLSEEGFRTDPGSGLDRLRMLAAVPGVSVVCSQGGVIPDAVAALTAGTGLTDDAATSDGLPARKASIWVLGSRAGEVVFADYYPDHNG